MADRKIVVTSGYFDPLHVGHIRLLEDAKKLGDWLVVIVNNDKQASVKKGKPFMPAEERAKVIQALKVVDEVIVSLDDDQTVRLTLRHIKPHVFAKGGDSVPENVPELEICRELGIEAVFGVGGEEIQSRYWLKKKVQ